ncbi:hypothetical protein PUN28_008332 [Cardiocondyla obscurior]|uniref:Uncharacterized protein n=1 Tax=Cardiocondyla obscurior TaxID=286306 RepID=A0AAW2G066_9HYME
MEHCVVSTSYVHRSRERHSKINNRDALLLEIIIQPSIEIKSFVRIRCIFLTLVCSFESFNISRDLSVRQFDFTIFN